MSGIRVTYSGLISFVFGISSVITGLIFTLIVTRNLTQTEFGTWSLIGGLTSYVLIINPIIAYWTTREIARGNKIAKTSLLSSSSLSILAVGIYLVIILFFNYESVDYNILLFASILIPIEFVRRELIAISIGHKPHLAELSAVIFEIVKIPTAIMLIYFLDMSIIGVIITSAISGVSSIIFLLLKISNLLLDKFSISHLKKWIKLGWLPLYPKIAGVLHNADVAVFTIITGSVGGLAYWAAAKAVSGMITHSSKINKAVYPKLLSGGKKEILEENLVRVLYFTFPLSMAALVFAKPGLFALNPIYEIAVPVVLVLVPAMILKIFTNVFSQSLSGIEKVDTKEQSTFKDYIKSKLFFLPTLTIIQYSIYIISLIVTLHFTVSTSLEVELVMYWALIAAITELPITIFLYKMARKEFSLKINVIPIIKYLISAIASFIPVYLLMEKYLEYNNKIIEFLPDLFQYMILGSLLYLGLTFVIDSKTRKLIKSIIKELR